MRFSQARQTILRASVAVVAMSAVALSAGFASAATASPHGTINGNADFRGTWTQPGGGGSWTVNTQAADGTCTGVTYYGAGYGFTACKVTGNNYTFEITDGPSYTSVNTGTITGNSLSGSFDDGRGPNNYTATRTSGGGRAVSVTVVCDTPANPGQFGSCAATVADASGQSPLETPTGSVKLTATTGSLFGSQCNLTPSASAPSAPSCSLLYEPPAGGLPAGEAVPVSASYAGDSNFSSGTGGSTLIAASLADGNGDPLGICEGTTGDCTGYDESTAADEPAGSTSVGFTSDCSGAAEDPAARTAAEHLADDPAVCTVDGTATATPPSAAATSALLADQKTLNQDIQQLAADAQKTPTESQQQLQQQADKTAQDIQTITAQKTAAASTAAKIIQKNVGSAEVYVATPTKPIKTGLLGALDAVLLDHPTAAEIKAYRTTVSLATAKGNAFANELARYDLALVAAVGYKRLAAELHGKHGKLPSSIALGKVHATVAAGKQKHLSIKLSTIDQRLLRVVALLPKHASVTLKTTVTRPHIKRTGTAKLPVTVS